MFFIQQIRENGEGTTKSNLGSLNQNYGQVKIYGCALFSIGGFDFL